MWGTNNCDHQARICHSTTVAGVAQTFGYGAMTNSFNDLHYSKAVMFIGSNPAEAHPISMLHALHAKELGAKIVVVDPRFTRTARFAHQLLRVRPGTDIPLVWGMLWHIFQNGWEDKSYIEQRTYGMEEVRKEVAKWTPDKVADVTGMPRSASAPGRRNAGLEQAVVGGLVHGHHPAPRRHRQCARPVHPATGAGQYRQGGRRHQYLPGPRQRAGRHRRRAESRFLARLLRPGRRRLEIFLPPPGASITTGSSRATVPRN